MMLSWSVGLTAIDVSLCGLFASQLVLTLAAVDVAVVHSALPFFVAGPLPKTECVTGAGASTTLWTKSTGWLIPSPSSAETTAGTASASTATAAARRNRIGDRALMGAFLRLGQSAVRAECRFPRVWS